APLEQRFAGDVLHVHEQRLGEAAQVHETHDVGLPYPAIERPGRGADRVLLVGQALADHGILPRSKIISHTSERGAYVAASSPHRYTVSCRDGMSTTPTRLRFC